jgi:hypothetical protein
MAFWNCLELLQCLLNVITPDHPDVELERHNLHLRMFALALQWVTRAPPVRTAEE